MPSFLSLIHIFPYRFSNQLNAAGEEVPYAAPEMRRDPLTGDWIPMATARMNRPITAGPGATAKGNPLAARKPGDPYQDGEVPDTDYNVVCLLYTSRCV